MDKLLTVSEVAEILRASPARVRQMAAEGELPMIRVSPRRIRIARDKFYDWLASRTTGPTCACPHANKPVNQEAAPGETTKGGAMSDARLLSTRQAAAYLGISTRTIWRMVATGQLPAPLPIGKRIRRWRRADLDQFLVRAEKRRRRP